MRIHSTSWVSLTRQRRRRPVLVTVLAGLLASLVVATGQATATTATVSEVTASWRTSGQVDLRWQFAPADGVDSYQVHRSSDGPDFTPGEETLVTQTTGTTVADMYPPANTDLWYRVVATTADGTQIGVTEATRVATGEPVDHQAVTTFAALPESSGVRFVFRLPAAAAENVVRIYGSAGPADAGQGTLLGEYRADSVSVLWKPKDARERAFRHYSLEAGEHSATADLTTSGHPRLGLTPKRLTDVRERIQLPGAVQDSYRAMKARVDAGLAPYGRTYNAHAYRAREAAFIYAVSGDRAYAQEAYRGLVAHRPYIGQGGAILLLELSRSMLLYSSTYDWAYHGLTDQQRADLRRDFSKAAGLFSTARAANVDIPADKASNWVGVARSAEMLMHLTTYGEPGVDRRLADARLPVLVDEIVKHIDQGYGDSGWAQEGWNYFQYTAIYMLPSIFAAEDSGITAFERAMSRPAWWNWTLHELSLRADRSHVQQGATPGKGATDAVIPLLFPTTPAEHLPKLVWLYDHVVGAKAAKPTYDGFLGNVWNVLHYPADMSAEDPDESRVARRAMLDDGSGAYQFRSRYQDADDALIGVTNRNHNHNGWDGDETFALSLIHGDATWAQHPGKDVFNIGKYSRPLVDGSYTPGRTKYGIDFGEGRTLESRAFADQPGGYVSLDGHRNYRVDTARRDIVVDMAAESGADTVLAVHDVFADDTSHSWDWQLSPESGVGITYGDVEDGMSTFTFRKGSSWLKGWVVDPDGSTVSIVNGAFRVTRTGTSADFRILIAMGAGDPVEATRQGNTVQIGSQRYDFSDLGSFDRRPR